MFSVLKSDFSKLYEEINENPFLIRDLAEQTPSERVESLKKIECDDLNNLAGFLSKIEDLVSNDPRPFIYFNNEELNPLTGRLDLEEIKKFVLNGQGEEIKKRLNDNNINDLNLVFSSVLTDISSNIEVKKLFTILFYYPELADYIDEKDKVALSELFKHNLESVLGFELKNVLMVFEKIVNNSTVWKRLGKLIEEKGVYGELLQAHIDKYELVDKLQINSIYTVYEQKAFEIGEYYEDNYFVPKLLMELPLEHPIIARLNWLDTLLSTLHISENEDENSDIKALNFNLSTWLSTVVIKTTQVLTVSHINKILNAYSFKDYKSLQNIVDLWIQHFKDSDIKQLSQFLSIIDKHIIKITNDEELNHLGNLVSSFNDKLLKVNKDFITTLYNDYDTDDFIKISNAFSETSYIAEFAIEHFSFDKNKFNEHLLNILVYRDNFYNPDALNEIMTKASNEIFNNADLSGLPLLSNLINESDIWLSTAKEYNKTWFNLDNDENFWLRWDVSDESFEELMNIYYQLFKTEENIWNLLIDSVKYFASINDYYNRIPNNYRHLWKEFVNKGFNFIVKNNNSEDDWIVALDKFHSIQSVFNPAISKPIFNYLEQESLNNFVAKVPKVVSFNNKNLNDLIFEYAELENTNQLNNVISRWEHFSIEQRISLTEKIPKEKEEVLLKHVIENAEIKFIDEIADYNLDSIIKDKIMFAIIKHVDTFTINKWIEETLDLLIESDVNSWRLRTIKHAINKRFDLGKPDIEILGRLLEFKDERTTLALEIILALFSKEYRNKNEFKEIRKRILLLEAEVNFKELVYDAKEKYGWRNNILA